MTVNKKIVKDSDGKDELSYIRSASWFRFVTFSWLFPLIDSLKNEDFELPNMLESEEIKKYSHKLGENLRKVSIKKHGLFNNFYKKGNSYTYIKYKQGSNRARNREYYIHYNDIALALIKTFKSYFIGVSLSHAIHAIFLMFIAHYIERYVLIIKGNVNISFPIFFGNWKILYGFFIIFLLCISQFFDAIIYFYENKLAVDMEVAVMHFLYKINLGSSNNLVKSYSYMERETDERTNTSYKEINKNLDKRESSFFVEENSCMGTLCSNSIYQKRKKNDQNNDLCLNTKDYYSIYFNNEIYISDQHIKNRDQSNTFVRTPSSIRRNDGKGDKLSKKITKNISDNENNFNINKEQQRKKKKKHDEDHPYQAPEDEEYDLNVNEFNLEEKDDNITNDLLIDGALPECSKRQVKKKKHFLTSLFNKKKEEKKIKGDENIMDLNIYNIMFVDIPHLVNFLGSMLYIANVLIKFTVSFYIFYVKMGSSSALNGALLVFILYSLMFLFEFLSILHKKKYLKYRDSRIDNMHHVLKEYKLMKIFNWESIAFDYVNFYRKKEIKYCKIRFYLSSLSNYVNTISCNVVEVVLFFFYLREELKNKKEINFSSIITPLFVYRSVISSISNVPNLMNYLLEGIVNIKRINRYIYYYLYYNDINNYFKYFSKNNNEDTNIFIEDIHKNETTGDSQYSKNDKNKKRKRFSFCFFRKKNKNSYLEDGEQLNGLSYDTNEMENVKCFKDTTNCADNYSSTYFEKRNYTNSYNKIKKEDDAIIKLENCYFSLNKEGDNKLNNCILKNINFNLKNNTVAIIIGSVGSGKTVFFKSILRDFKLSYGYLYVKNFIHDMPILYVPQNSWVSIGTIRSMILFGNKYDPLIYYRVILQSELINDMISFKKKDMRYINDEHTLSKGQKSRICLARALYHHYIHMNELSCSYEKEIKQNKKFKINISSENIFQYNTNSIGDNNKTKMDTSVYDLHTTDEKNEEYKQNLCNENVSINCDRNINILKNNGGIETNNSYNLKSTLDVYSNNNNDKINNVSSEDNSKEKGISVETPFNINYIRDSLRKRSVSYLYLLDDLFTALDPCISKDIFYNLFCKNKENEYFKEHCSFVVSMNENIFNSFLTSDILNNLQYKIDVYNLENDTLEYQGNISEYMKKKNMNIKTDNNFNKKKLNINDIKLKLDIDQEEYNKKKNDVKYNKYKLLKQLKEMYSFKINEGDDDAFIHNNDKYASGTQQFLENEFVIDTSGNNNNSSIKKMEKEKNSKKELKEEEKSYLYIYNRISKYLPPEVKGEDENMDIDNDNESRFTGNIGIETFLWYFKKIGFVLICIITFFMILSTFTEEIKNIILFTASTMFRSNNSSINDFLNEQMNYLYLYILLPVISLLTTFLCFMMIAHGVLLAAVRIHTETLTNILYAPIHVLYSNNLGNIINRFITDIGIIDDGVIKRIYKCVSTLFKFVFTSFFLVYMVKDTIFVIPFIILLIYFIIFKRYSKGCKEAQRGYLSSHAPLCNIYSNIILGKDIINLYKKNSYFLEMYEYRTNVFRNYSIFKWSITVWASTYIQLIVLILTTFYIFYSYMFFKKKNSFHNGTNERDASTIGYCITYSCTLGFIIKCLLYEFTHVEKEMCSAQRLEEYTKLINKDDASNKNVIETIDSSGNKKQKKIQKKKKHEKNEKKNENIRKSDNLAKTSPICSNTENLYIGVAESKQKYGIHFENVFVSYKKKVYLNKKRNIYNYINEASCLKNINIYALKNQKIGVVGKSGSGKSTMLLTILGILPLTKGKITIEGIDISTMDKNQRNNVIGILPQSAFVFFNWNIRTFIDPYKNFNDEEIVDAFKLIGINLTFKDLDKYIYKQRKKKIMKKKNKKIDLNNFVPLTDDCIRYLSLVRLFLNRNKYKLILIDEIPVINFSDNNLKLNEFFKPDIKPFEFVIRNYFPNTTTLIISHDTRSLTCCDFIYVMRKGEIVYRCSNKDVQTQMELANILEQNN